MQMIVNFVTSQGEIYTAHFKNFCSQVSSEGNCYYGRTRITCKLE